MVNFLKTTKRRNNSRPGRFLKVPAAKNAFRPESITSRAMRNSRILSQIKKKPAVKIWPRRRRPGGAAAAAKKPLTLAFSMPILPVIALVFLGTIFVMDNRTSISAMINRDVIPAPQPDSGGEINMAAFVSGANGQGAVTPQVPAAVVQQPAAETQLTAAVSQPSAADASSQAIKDESIPLKMTEYFAWESYTVKRGDSVSSIAASHGLTMDAILTSNNLPNAHLLKIGQNLRIPNMNGIPYTVKKGDSLYKISQSYNIPLAVLADVNNIQHDLIIPGQNIFLPGARMPAKDLKLAIGKYFVSPLSGAGLKLSSGFGWREDPFGGGQRLHEAVDMAISTGTPVKAASGGKVSMVGNSPVYGKYIILSHSDNFQTLYAHLSVCSVKTGDTVEQGKKIGEVGSTGLSTGPHLHFAVYKNSRAVNPLDYFSL